MKYSIVITATRPHMLQHALRSALAQTFDDYEIVVSDNSPEGCRDMVEAFGDERVRYARPDSPMGLVAHWDFAFAQARGDWQLQLCDDDAVTPNLLSILDNLIHAHPDVDAICWSQGVYSDDAEIGVLGKCNRLGVGEFTGQATRYEASTLLAEMFDSGSGLFRVKPRIPFFPRSVCRREVLDAIRDRQGHLFHPICPMTSGAVAVLSFSKATLRIDLPLRILGMAVDSCSGWAVDSSTMETSHAGIDVELAPIKQYRILPTAQIEALLRTQRAMPERLGQYKVNYVNYFLHCDEFLQEYERYGLDPGPYRQVFEDALAQMPADVQVGVRAAIAAAAAVPERNNLYWSARKAARSLINKVRGPRLPGEVDADRLGLGNIYDCAVYIGSMVDRRVSQH